MAYDQHKNLVYSKVAVAPSPATTGTSLTVTAGSGTQFPTPPFNATVWPANQIPLIGNSEIVRVTNIVGDVLTIGRLTNTEPNNAASARTIQVGDQIVNSSSAKLLLDLETNKVEKSGDTMTGRLSFSGTTHPGVQLNSLTTTQRNVLTATNGMLLYNSTLSQVQKYENSQWVDVSRSPATKTIAPAGSGYAADYYTTGTNDNTVIQTAINALPAGGGKILLQTGTYIFGNVITTLISNLTIQGQGETTILKLANGANSRMFYNPTTVLSTITFQDLQLDGNGSNQTDGANRDDRALVMLFNITNLKVLNCFIHDCRSGASIRISGCNRILYQGNIFLNNGMSGGAFMSDHTFVGDSTNYRVVGNHYENCTDTGTAQDGVINSTVIGNTYINCQGQGVSVSASTLRNSQYNTVANNVIDGTGSLLAAGIKVSSFGNGGLQTDTEIHGNVITSCDRAMWLDEFIRLTVVGNHLLNAQGSNKQLMLLGAVNTNTDVIIADNTFYNTTNRGISFDTASTIVNAHIHDNKFISVNAAIGGTIPNGAKIHDNEGYDSQSVFGSVASANNLSLAGYNKYFPISGTTQINLIDSTTFEPGSVITFRFQSNITVKHNQAASGNNKSVILKNGVDMAAVDGNTLTLVYDGVGNAWFEVAREAPTGSSITSKSANYTINVGDSTILGNATSGAFTLTLPDATTCKGYKFDLKKTDASANTITVATSPNTQTIDGVTTFSIATQNQSITPQSDGANWYLI